MKHQTRRFQRADDAIQLVSSEYDFDISILSERDRESHCISGHADKHNSLVSRIFVDKADRRNVHDALLRVYGRKVGRVSEA